MKRISQALLILWAFSWLPPSGANVAWARETAGLRAEPGGARGRSTIATSQVERLRRVMIPLLKATDHPRRLEQIQVKVLDDPTINAASAGNGEFYVTTGLLDRANDEELRGVLAHEIAHDDLGHPARAQLMNTGLGLGVMLLEQFIPGSRALAPVAGTLIARSYSRPQEYEADRHAVEILRRAGYSKDVMVHTLSWLMRSEGNSGGGILSTHPATSDRIQALRSLR